MMTMELKKQLREALSDAMKSGDTLGKMTLRMALAAIKNAEVEKQADLDDATVMGLLQKEVKARLETIDGAKQANRQDLVEKAQAEIDVLSAFLPKPISEEELRQIVQASIEEAGAVGMSDIGKVMGILMPKIKGKADGKAANQIVRELLQAG